MTRPRWSALPLRTKGLLVALVPAIPVLFLWALIGLLMLRPAGTPSAAARDREARGAMDRLAAHVFERRADALADAAHGRAPRSSDRVSRAIAVELNTLSKAIDDEDGRQLVGRLADTVANDGDVRQAIDAVRAQRTERLAAATASSQRRARVFFWGFLAASLLAVGGGIWIAMRLIGGTAARMEQVVAGADRIARGEAVEAPAVGEDEIGRLGQRLHDLMLLLRDRERLLAERNRELADTNRELEAFSYSVSHDLRAPLRAISGFSKIVEEDYADRLDRHGLDNLRRVRAATERMSVLIDDLLNFSKLSRVPVHACEVNVSSIAHKIVAQLKEAEPDRSVDILIAPEVWVQADPHLVSIAVENLLDNAWKYTRRTREPRIALTAQVIDGQAVLTIRDNGAGFDMAHAGMLFGPFQRLHSQNEFEGNGIGLATVQRIVHRHGGQIRGEGAVGVGAAFEFTLPAAQRHVA